MDKCLEVQIKIGIHTQLDSGSNIHCVPPGYTPFSGCDKQNCLFICMHEMRFYRSRLSQLVNFVSSHNGNFAVGESISDPMIQEKI